jgi:hypothetical protein
MAVRLSVRVRRKKWHAIHIRLPGISYRRNSTSKSASKRMQKNIQNKASRPGKKHHTLFPGLLVCYLPYTERRWLFTVRAF